MTRVIRRRMDGNDTEIQRCLLEHSTHKPPCSVFSMLLRLVVQIQGLQSGIHFLLYICEHDKLMKRGCFSETIPSLFKNAVSPFLQVPRGQTPPSLRTAENGKDFKVQHQREMLYMPALSSKLYRRHPWTINPQLFLVQPFCKTAAKKPNLHVQCQLILTWHAGILSAALQPGVGAL